VKRKVHQELDKICPTKTILTTNSSILPVSAMEDVVVRGDRFAALHSHLGSPLVDSVAGPRTHRSTEDVLKRYVESTKGVPLVLQKEYPGYVLNAMLGPVLGTALALVVDGVATKEQIDRAWMQGLRATMGPFGMMDLFGLNIIFDSWKNRELDARTRRLQPKVLELLHPYIETKKLGIKSGSGFYDYPAPAYQVGGFLEQAENCQEAQNALYVALISNALLLVDAGVLEAANVNHAWKVGTHLDIGPFEVLAGMGHAAFRQALADEVAAVRVDSGKACIAMHWLEQQSTATEPGLEIEQR
jgi:3-hydroxybutyryl-CoA dehydrogenase